MSVIGRRPVLLLLVVALATGGVGATAAADVRPARNQAPTRTTERAPTTTVVQAAAPADRSAPVTVLLVGLGAVAGVIVGIIPALTTAMLLGYAPLPRRGRRDAGVLVEPAGSPPPSLDGLTAAGPSAPAPSPAPVALAVAQEPPADQSPNPVAILAHARHQPVYDAAYAAQLERVEALRATIGGRLRHRPEPPSD